MAKVCILGDTHFGRNHDSLFLEKYFGEFLDNTFFPYLKEHGIKTIIHMGDLVDKRETVNFRTLSFVKNRFINRCISEGMDLHIILGNHDTYYKNTVHLNALREIFEHSVHWNNGVHVYDHPKDIVIDGRSILMIPWIAPENSEECFNAIKESKSQIACGHLELNGFKLSQFVEATDGHDPNDFKKFKMVLTGHFHIKQDKGNIVYVGTPYQLDFGDCEIEKGFHILDTRSMDLKFIRNDDKLFYKLNYDDGDKKHLLIKPSDYTGKYVRLFVGKMDNPIEYDQFVIKMNDAKPAEFSIIRTAEPNLARRNLLMKVLTKSDKEIMIEEVLQFPDLKHQDRIVKHIEALFNEADGVVNDSI